MTQTKNKKITKELHIKNIRKAFEPTHTALLNNYSEASNNAIERNKLKLAVLKTHTDAMDKKGRLVVEAENYCDLLNFDQSLVVPGLTNLADIDTNHLKSIERQLISKGLFNMAETFSLLRKKSEKIYSVHQSFKSLENSKNARTPKPIELIEFNSEVKQWAINLYLKDREDRLFKKLPIRMKKGSESSADAWLLDMANREVVLQRPPKAIKLEATSRADGTLFGFPELPLEIDTPSFSKRFFQKCLKNI